MPARHVIVDGSNLATEGRSMPSLEQLDQAVREFMAENPNDVVTVVVDASFGHRIDPSEVPTFDEAEAAGEVISPPAGAIGRGDAFLLRIAEKVGATVLSNDSFQEFHGDHPWLFEKGRLVGGKPVPGVGWIFMDRTPVRGQKSREVVKEAKRRKRTESGAAGDVEPKGLDLASSKAKGRPKAVDRAIARATQEVVEPKADGKRRRRGGEPPSEPVNEPLAFITFIAAHPLGSVVVGLILEFSSHGVFVLADGARCYVPLSAMGDPPPRRAREVVSKGEERQFVVQAFDPQRRGIELAIPGFARVAGSPTAETVEAEIHEVRSEPKKAPRKETSGKARRAAAPAGPVPDEAAPTLVTVGGPSDPVVEAQTRPGSAGVKKAARARAGAASEAAAGSRVAAPSEGEARPAKKAAAKKAGAAKKAAAQKAAAKAGGPAKAGAAGAERAEAADQADGTSGRSAPPAKKAGGAKKAAPVKKGAAKKAGGVSKAAPAKAADKAAAPKKVAAGTAAAPTKKAAPATRSARATKKDPAAMTPTAAPAAGPEPGAAQPVTDAASASASTPPAESADVKPAG
jgi:hypothetical protein